MRIWPFFWLLLTIFCISVLLFAAQLRLSMAGPWAVDLQVTSTHSAEDAKEIC